MIRNWFRKNKWRFSEYLWYRKWYGGNWVKWRTSLPMVDVWLIEGEHCGCAMKVVATESYRTVEDGHS